MAKGGLGITMINMYCDMVDQEFATVIAILEARTAGIRTAVERQVKKDLGVYSLLMKKAALTEQIKEIEMEMETLTSRYRCNRSNFGSGYMSRIEEETNKRMQELNQQLYEAIAAKDSLKRSIKLSSASGQIAELFAALGPEVQRRLEMANRLPPIEIPLIEEYPNGKEND